MRIFSINRGVKGSRTLQEYAIRFAYMISETAKSRARILTLWKTHGLAATVDAHDIHRRTLFSWQKRLRGDRGKLESLNSRSTAPKVKRRRLWDHRIIEEIKRLRFEHHNLGKDKLYPLLKEYCDKHTLLCPKEKTIGRIFKDLGGLRMVPERITGTGRINPITRLKTERKPHGFTARYPGHCVAFDTFEEHINGSRRYVITLTCTRASATASAPPYTHPLLQKSSSRS